MTFMASSMALTSIILPAQRRREDERRRERERRAVAEALQRPLVHLIARDGTDQAECRSEADVDRCTPNPAEVDCLYCIDRLDDDADGSSWRP